VSGYFYFIPLNKVKPPADASIFKRRIFGLARKKIGREYAKAHLIGGDQQHGHD